jgi:hypothetical protein
MNSQVEDLMHQITSTKKAIKMLDFQLEGLMNTLDEYRANGLLDDYEGEDGTFYVNGSRLVPVTRNSWAYSKAVKELQEQEQVSGAATRKQTTYLRIDPPKQ